MVSATDWRPPGEPPPLEPPPRGTPSQWRIPSPTSSVPMEPTLDTESLQIKVIDYHRVTTRAEAPPPFCYITIISCSH